MQTGSTRPGGKPSKWYLNLTTQVVIAMLLALQHGIEPVAV
jgi:hypothetical protein